MGRTPEFVKILREQFDTSVVPGEFFEHPQHFRVGFCGATETVRGGLERLSAALEALQQRPRRENQLL
jgi:aspartate/methionine/tyrosine aminotransferase